MAIVVRSSCVTLREQLSIGATCCDGFWDRTSKWWGTYARFLNWRQNEFASPPKINAMK